MAINTEEPPCASAGGTPKKTVMKSGETTSRAPIDLDATDEFPVLDAAAYEAKVLSAQAAGSSDNGTNRQEAEASSVAGSHAEQAALIAGFRGQIEDLSARLTTSEAERRALEERVAALTKGLADRHSRLRRLESMNAELRETVGQLNTSLAERSSELQRGHANRLRPPAGTIEHR